MLILHHPSKGTLIEGQGARGSGALAAAVDINIEMSRPVLGETQRRLRAWSRLPATPDELIIERNRDGTDYVVAEPIVDDDSAKFRWC